MPSKKKLEDDVKDNGEPSEVIETPHVSPARSVCGHINRHSIGLDKKPDNIACDKPSGHGGDHSGIHQEYFKEYETKVIDGREVTTVLLVAQERRVEWGDMAGILVSQIPRPQPPAPPTVGNLEKRLRELENRALREGEFINK